MDNNNIEHISSLPGLIFSMITHHSFMMVAVLASLILYLACRRSVPIYLLDYTCYKPPSFYRLPHATFVEHVLLEDQLDEDSMAFQIKILEKSGYSEETNISQALFQIPIRKSLKSHKEEAADVLFSAVGDLLQRSSIKAKAIDILITNCCMFSPTPSLSAMVVNKFRMRSNIMSYNLSGMGCSAGIISVGLAKDLLRAHRNSLALIVSSEILTLNWYTGKDRSKLLTNCLFRMGGAAILMSSREQDKKRTKYELQHLVRTNRAKDDQSYACVFQDTDMDNKVGVSISKGIVKVAGEALKANMASLGLLVLPVLEQLRYGLSMICQKVKISGKTSIYVPDFKGAFQHFCIHAGGMAVIQGIGRSLNLSKENVEASEMTLHRFGNTSSSSVWYELSYLEAKGRMKRGDRVWQIAFGSGFKCTSAVWKCFHDIGPEIESVWHDQIDSYPVDIPDTMKLVD